MAIEIRNWVSHRLDADVERSLQKLARAEGAKYLAVMPDVHLASAVCIGTVFATDGLLYPSAVGSDIGCGILAIQLDSNGVCFDDERQATALLQGLSSAIPHNRHPSSTVPTGLPEKLQQWPLSHPKLESMKLRDGIVQLGTLGRGNHFLELQADPDGEMWLMIHSGSRGLGQAISGHHDKGVNGRLVGLDISTPEGQCFWNDMRWAREYAHENRIAMMRSTLNLLQTGWGISAIETSLVHTDHNHVDREEHFQESWFVHRKGAQRLEKDQPGIVPGSMGTISYLVSGRGNPLALQSCSHGAGRQMSRTEAKRKVDVDSLTKQMDGVRFDRRLAFRIREEAPQAYKDVRKVMKDQKSLVRVTRHLRPILNFKGT